MTRIHHLQMVGKGSQFTLGETTVGRVSLYLGTSSARYFEGTTITAGKDGSSFWE